MFSSSVPGIWISLLLLIAIIFNIVTTVNSSSATAVVVESAFGKIQGLKKTDENSGQSYLSFEGIPYAKPPIGELRFAKPQPHPVIDGVFDATKDEPIVCPHPYGAIFGLEKFTEDCLVLNIHVKSNTGWIKDDAVKKVIVYIHGGGYHFGAGFQQDPTSFIIRQDVIVVTLNYRLGILGFLSTENEASPGNYGLWDQALGIKWVKDNIRAFGGDPDDITIAGESAGGAAVGLQSLTPYTKGFFTKVFQLSGSATSIFSLSLNAQSHALAWAHSVGCWEGESQDKICLQESRKVMSCLRELPISAITRHVTLDISKNPFMPRVDGDFIPDKPVNLLNDDAYLDSVGFFDRTYLVSIVNNEVGLIESFMSMTKAVLSMNDDLTTEVREAAFDKFVVDCIDMQMSRLSDNPKKIDNRIIDEVMDFYNKRFHNKEEILTELMTDLNMFVPPLDFLNAASRRPTNSATYSMFFNHFPRFVTGQRKGTPHEADLAFWFDFDLEFVEKLVNAGIRPELFDEDDKEIKRMFSDMIGEFARSGNPGHALKEKLPNGWPMYDVMNSHYLNFNLKPWIDSFLEKDRQEFWLKTIPSLMEKVVESSTVVVESPFGKIQGLKKTDENSGQSYLSFQGIPYAKPPVGELRFAKPQPHPVIDGVFDASKEVKIWCPHPSSMTLKEYNIQEDCLILNIHTRDVQPSKELRKVMIFIHGGGFIVGSSAVYDPTSFIISQDVIVVTINYRIGILGFLSTENEASPGNYGLWDQTLAIKWVKDNIRAFGGDPDDITVAGESAGGASVGYQTISPYTKGLFTKAYPQSGTATAVFARSINAQLHALNFGKLVGCWDKEIESKINVQDSSTLLNCLRTVPVSAFAELNGFTSDKTQFAPVVDGDFVPDIPAKLLQDDDYLESIGFFDRSYLVGLNNREIGIIEVFLVMTKKAIYSNNQTSDEQKELAYTNYLAACKKHYMISRLGESAASDENIINKVDDFYKRRLPENEVLHEIITDLSFLIPSIDYLRAIARRPLCNSYFLHFDHFPQYMKGKYRGSPHALDLAYWFDVDLERLEVLLKAGIRGEFSKEDIELKKSFSALVGDFTKTGNPGVTLKTSIPSGWPKYDVTNSFHLNFNSRPWVSSFLEKDKQDLWFDTVPKLIKTSHIHSEL